LLSEIPKSLEGQSGPGPLDRCAECCHPMRRATDRVDYKFFTLDASKQTILGHFGGVIPKRRKFRFPEDLGVFFHSSCAPDLGVKLDPTDSDYAALPKELREQFEAGLKAIWAYRDKQPKKYAVSQRKGKNNKADEKLDSKRA